MSLLLSLFTGAKIRNFFETCCGFAKNSCDLIEKLADDLMNPHDMYRLSWVWMSTKMFYTIWLGATNWEFKGTKRGVYSKETGSLLRPKWGVGRLKPCDLYVLEYQVVRMGLSGGERILAFWSFKTNSCAGCLDCKGMVLRSAGGSAAEIGGSCWRQKASCWEREA